MDDGSAEQWRRADDEVRKNLPSGVKLVRTLRGHTGWIGRIAWSPDGRMLASPSWDGTIRLWDTETGKCIRTLKGHKSLVVSVAFDPMGRTLASGSHGGIIKLWDLDSGKRLRTLKGHTRSVIRVAFDPKGRTLASGSVDGTVKLWEPISGNSLNSFRGYYDLHDLAFNPKGYTLASAEGRTVKLWEATSGKLIHLLTEDKYYAVDSIAFDPTGSTLASGCGDNTIKLWDLDSGKLLRILEEHTTFVRSVSFSADGRFLFSQGGDDNGSIQIWRTDAGTRVTSIPELASEKWPPGLAFNPRLPLLATVGSDPRHAKGRA